MELEENILTSIDGMQDGGVLHNATKTYYKEHESHSNLMPNLSDGT